MLFLVFGLLCLSPPLLSKQYLLSMYYVPGIVLRQETYKSPCLVEFMSWGETDNKLINV